LRSIVSRSCENAMFLALTVTVSGLDLRQIEDVADEIEQVGAGRVDGFCEFHLARAQVAVRIVRSC